MPRPVMDAASATAVPPGTSKRGARRWPTSPASWRTCGTGDRRSVRYLGGLRRLRAVGAAARLPAPDPPARAHRRHRAAGRPERVRQGRDRADPAPADQRGARPPPRIRRQPGRRRGRVGRLRRHRGAGPAGQRSGRSRAPAPAPPAVRRAGRRDVPRDSAPTQSAPADAEPLVPVRRPDRPTAAEDPTPDQQRRPGPRYGRPSRRRRAAATRSPAALADPAQREVHLRHVRHRRVQPLRHAAAVAVAESPAQAYNPLFI